MMYEADRALKKLLVNMGLRCIAYDSHFVTIWIERSGDIYALIVNDYCINSYEDFNDLFDWASDPEHIKLAFEVQSTSFVAEYEEAFGD